MSSVFLVEIRGLGDRDEICDTIAVVSSLDKAIAVCLDPETKELTDEVAFRFAILEAQIDSPIVATSIRFIEFRDGKSLIEQPTESRPIFFPREEVRKFLRKKIAQDENYHEGIAIGEVRTHLCRLRRVIAQQQNVEDEDIGGVGYLIETPVREILVELAEEQGDRLGFASGD